MAKNNFDLRTAVKTSFLSSVGKGVDPVEWIERNLGVELYSNQIENVDCLFNPDIPVFSVLGCRGAGKTLGISAGLVAYSLIHPGLRVIIAAPKEKQSGRLVKEMTILLKDKKSQVGHFVDWRKSTANRLQFKSGGYVVALSGQEGANIEGEHGHILVIDEAHLVPSYSVTNKLTPMIGMLDISKVIKIGVSMGRNHFYKTCMTPNAVVNKCPWNKAEIFLSHGKPSEWYNKRQYPRALLDRMPLPYKKSYFPDRPDLHILTGMEVSTLDWKTQYELEWTDDISNFLSDDDQDLLSDGSHSYLIKGVPGETYAVGMDTAQGSISKRKNTDETVVAIWRKRGEVKEKVASFIWKGDPLTQMDEIWEIVNPKTGLFKCNIALVDYSNIGINIVELFKRRDMNIAGKHFQQTEKESKKNWKNAMFDYFQVQLQTGRIKYPNIRRLEQLKPDAHGDDLTQISNMLRGFWEWSTLQRLRGSGLNDHISAPEENVEGEDGESTGGKDDVCCADVMAVWALDKFDQLREELSTAGDLSYYQIPSGTAGMHSRAGGTPQSAIPTEVLNPALAQTMKTQKGAAKPLGTDPTASGGWMSNILDAIASKK